MLDTNSTAKQVDVYWSNTEEIPDKVNFLGNTEQWNFPFLFYIYRLVLLLLLVYFSPLQTSRDRWGNRAGVSEDLAGKEAVEGAWAWQVDQEYRWQ